MLQELNDIIQMILLAYIGCSENAVFFIYEENGGRKKILEKNTLKTSLSTSGLSLCGVTYPCAQGILHLFKAHDVFTDHSYTKPEASRRELKFLSSLVCNKR